MFVEHLAAAGVPVELVPMRRKVRPLADMQAWACLVGLIRERHYDVVHAHSSKAGVIARLGAGRCGVPVTVYTPNAFAFLGARTLLLRWLYLVIERVLGHRFTDALVCVSRSERELAVDRAVVPLERLALIENAIDSTFFSEGIDRDLARSQLGFAGQRPAIGYVGRLAGQKGLGCLIQAARRVVDEYPEVQFVLVGEGELERAIRRKVLRLGLDGHVRLTGFRTDIPHVLAALDIFVLPSQYEGLPYTLMEAMAANCAAVATDVGGNRDLIQSGVTGILVQPSAPSKLADALLYLLERPGERRRLGDAARAVARERATPQEMALDVVALYDQLLERKTKRA
jgi:glycosyltransferase involved in cell wall biosynthesis